MNGLALRPRPGRPLAIDLLNTKWRLDDDHEFDSLLDESAVIAFNQAHGIALTAAPAVEAVRSALLRARELIRQLFASATIDTELADELNFALTDATVKLLATTGALEVKVLHRDPTQSVAVQAIINAIELIHDHPNRIRTCAHPECVIWFLDTSKSGHRKWCSMDRCGNRLKAKRHYERSRRF